MLFAFGSVQRIHNTQRKINNEYNCIGGWNIVGRHLLCACSGIRTHLWRRICAMKSTNFRIFNCTQHKVISPIYTQKSAYEYVWTHILLMLSRLWLDLFAETKTENVCVYHDQIHINTVKYMVQHALLMKYAEKKETCTWIYIYSEGVERTLNICWNYSLCVLFSERFA